MSIRNISLLLVWQALSNDDANKNVVFLKVDVDEVPVRFSFVCVLLTLFTGDVLNQFILLQSGLDRALQRFCHAHIHVFQRCKGESLLEKAACGFSFSHVLVLT